MPTYRSNVATFEVPAGWQDQSITAFKLPAAPGGGEASFVLTSDAAKGTQPFAAYFAGQADTCARSLPDYAELKRELFHANDRDAAWLEFQFSKDRARLHLRQIYFDNGYEAVICTLTGAAGTIGHHEAEWRRLMSSLTFDKPAAPAYP